MRNFWAFLVAASIIAGTPAPAQNRVDMSGTWIISMEDSGIELQSDRLRKFRRFDPGIGWPEGLSAQEDIVAGMLRPKPPPVTMLLAGLVCPAKFDQRIPARFFRAHAGTQVVLDATSRQGAKDLCNDSRFLIRTPESGIWNHYRPARTVDW